MAPHTVSAAGVGRSRRKLLVSVLAISTLAVVGTVISDGFLGQGWTEYHSERAGISLRYPDGWQVAALPLTPALASPGEVVSLGTYRMRAGGTCAQYPSNAIQDLPDRGALITLYDAGAASQDFPPRPRHFGPVSSVDDSDQCVSGQEQFSHYFLSFSDQERSFYAYVAIGAEATDARRGEVWKILDTLRVQPGGPAASAGASE